MFRDTLKTALLALCLIGTLTAFPAPSRAEDRPGTPNHVSLAPCRVETREQPGTTAICVIFDNTAREAVNFEYELTRNGVAWGDHPSWDCTPFNQISCKAARNFNGQFTDDTAPWYCGIVPLKKRLDCRTSGTGRTGLDQMPTGGPYPSLGATLRPVDYDAQYCIRVRARRVSDDMVSQLWSSWACVDTGAEPAPLKAPPAPEEVTVSYHPDGGHWSDPATVRVQWRGADGATGYVVEEAAGTGYSAPLVESFKQLQSTGRDGREFARNDFERGAFENNRNRFYRVCAMNKAGRRCSAAIPAKPFAAQPVDAFEQPSVSRTAQRVDRGLGAASGGGLAAVANARAQCRAGFVRRLANAQDQVCVTTVSRDAVSRENQSASLRVDPKGAYGPATCVAGYVWREANAADKVCVTPDRRTEVRTENRTAAERTP